MGLERRLKYVNCMLIRVVQDADYPDLRKYGNDGHSEGNLELYMAYITYQRTNYDRKFTIIRSD